MAKLIVGNWGVSNIDELRENYSCEIVFFIFANGTLLQWLKDSGYNDEAKAVKLYINKMITLALILKQRG